MSLKKKRPEDSDNFFESLKPMRVKWEKITPPLKNAKLSQALEKKDYSVWRFRKSSFVYALGSIVLATLVLWIFLLQNQTKIEIVWNSEKKQLTPELTSLAPTEFRNLISLGDELELNFTGITNLKISKNDSNIRIMFENGLLFGRFKKSPQVKSLNIESGEKSFEIIGTQFFILPSSPGIAAVTEGSVKLKNFRDPILISAGQYYADAVERTQVLTDAIIQKLNLLLKSENYGEYKENLQKLSPKISMVPELNKDAKRKSVSKSDNVWIYFWNGEKIQGIVLKETKEYVIFQLINGDKRQILRNSIQKISKK